MLKLILAVLLSASGVVKADEVDHWAQLNKPLHDSLEYLNQRVNFLLDEAIKDTNRISDCNETELFRNMRAYFKNRVSGWFNIWVFYTDKIDKRQIRARKSVYQDIGFFEAPTMGGLRLFTNVKLSPIIKLNDVFIGTDKLDHFFSTGRRFYLKYRNGKRSLDETLVALVKTELGYLGARTTGMASRADFVADINGFRFWSELIGEDYDILTGERTAPYVVCRNEKWVRVRTFDWALYVDQAWDESKNCNHYRTDRIKRKVRERVRRVEESTGQNLWCENPAAEVVELVNSKYASYREFFF